MNTRQSLGLYFGMCFGAFAGLLWPVVAAQSVAQPLSQPSHVEQFQSIVIECLGNVPGELKSFTLTSPKRMPFIRTSLIEYWQAEHKSVFGRADDRSDAGEKDRTASIPTLRYDIERAGVEFGKSSSGFIEREVFVSVRYELNGPDGKILSNNTCKRAKSDTLSTDIARLFKDDRFPETDVEPESRSWFKKAVQPAMIIGASVLGTALFFNLRSDRADGG